MTTTDPYIKRNPGDMITAEDWNALQLKIKEDLEGQVEEVETALDEHVQAPVNAATFDGKSPDEWKGELDGRFAHLDHYHDGVRRYRRYFLELETVVSGVLQPAVIDHKMGRHPTVQVYQLVNLPFAGESATLTKQLCFCGPAHHNDTEAAGFKTKSWDERHWGDKIDDKMIDDLARELDGEQQDAFKGKFKDDYTLNVWLSNLEAAFFDPGPGQTHFDMGDVVRTAWVKGRETKTVQELKQQGEWPARFVYRPRLINACTQQPVGTGDTALPAYKVEIYHLNLNEIEIKPNTAD